MEMTKELERCAQELNVERAVARDKIMNFEKVLSRQPGATFGDNDRCPLTHHFAPGVYVREIFIPKGTVLTGKIHRHSHPNFLMSGEVMVVTEHGGREHLKAPKTMISKAGTKRAVYALEDTVWVTVHVTEETDLEKIEEHVIAPTYAALGEGREKARLLQEPELERKNCLILALKELNRDYQCLLSLEATGTMLPFKEALERLLENGISVDGMLATQQKNGVWHVEVKEGTFLDGAGIEESDLVGTWMATAVGGAAVVGGAATSSAGKKGGKGAAKAGQLQLQGVRESLAAQSKMADKGYNVFEREAERARGFLREQAGLAREELQPLKEMGLKNLEMAQGFTDPNSVWSGQERDAYQKVLARNLSARGLTASGTEMAGLSDFELGLARERRNLSLGLAGQGANTLQSLSQLESGLGQGLAGITGQFGQSAMSLYGGAGANMGSTISQGYAGAGNALMAQGQYAAQGMMGIGNAFQGTASNLINLSLMNRMFPAAGGTTQAYQPLFPGTGGL